MSLVKDARRNIQECSGNVSSSEQAGVYHQLFQKQVDTGEGARFLRFPTQHEDNDYLGSYYKDGEANKSGQAIVEVINEEVMSLVSKFNWENYCNDASDRRCAPPCMLPSKGPSQESTPTTIELGSSMSPASRLAAEARTLAGDEFKTKLGLLICTDSNKLKELLKPNFAIA